MCPSRVSDWRVVHDGDALRMYPPEALVEHTEMPIFRKTEFGTSYLGGIGDSGANFDSVHS